MEKARPERSALAGLFHAWRVIFINPADDETSAQLIGRRKGQGIQMEGKLSGGMPIRWKYVVFTPTSFHWTGEKLASDGESWLLYLELFGNRSVSWTPGHRNPADRSRLSHCVLPSSGLKREAETKVHVSDSPSSRGAQGRSRISI